VIRLHPIPDVDHACVYCRIALVVKGWYMPGMRNLADLVCPRCERKYYGDLPVGHGILYPMLLERSTGTVHDNHGVRWFARWLGRSYKSRNDSAVEFIVEEFRPPRQAVLLNCLDGIYGHSLLKLLNAQRYLDRRPDLDLILLIPRFLRWLVPEGVSAVWTVGLPLERGNEWNDWLAGEIHRRLDPLGKCWLSIAVPHPHPADYEISRFTRTQPFPIGQWEERLKHPTVTFIWREDRIWERAQGGGAGLDVARRAGARMGLLRKAWREQSALVSDLGDALRRGFPGLDFAVVGLGEPRGLPDWISDMTTREISEQVERQWCERYARSHVVIGVHGSHMLLPTAHSGAFVELVPDKRWGNLVQDILVSSLDVREAMYRGRFLPLESSPKLVAEVTGSLLRDLPHALRNFRRRWMDEEGKKDDL